MISDSRIIIQFSPGTMYICFNEVCDEDCQIFENVSASKIIINMLKISKIFSKLVGSMLPMYKKGIKIILVVNEDSFVEKLFYRLGLNNIVTIYHSVNEALQKETI